MELWWGKLSFEGMPAFRDPNDGLIWVWDPESKTYVKKQEVDQPDRGHQTGGDNKLFDPFQHTEWAGVPELEGHMAKMDRADEWDWNWTPIVIEWDLGDVGEPFDPENMLPRDLMVPTEVFIKCIQNPDGFVELANRISNQYGRKVKDILVHRDVLREIQNIIQDKTPSDLVFPEDWTREAREFVPEGHVKCPNCTEITDQLICPNCGKELAPEWNQKQDKIDWHSQPHNPASEFTSWPDREPKRNRMKTDDSYPSMVSKVRINRLKLASKIAHQKLSQEEWEQWFAEGPARTEIGKWLQDSKGQLFYDQGLNVLHEDIARKNNVSKSEIAALGSVYNDGTADVQIIFPGNAFNQQSVEAQLQQVFGPVKLQGPISGEGVEQKGTFFQPIVIQSGQFLMPNANAPITGQAWVKERNNGTTFRPDMILVAEHLSPDDFEIYSQGVRAIITATGGLTSHAAQLAVYEGYPVIVGIGSDYNKIETGNYLKIDPIKEDITVLPYLTQTPQEKQQLYEYLRQYDQQRNPQLYNMKSFSHYDEEFAWRQANEPTLDECPECGAPMVDKYNDATDRLMRVCHDCGHKQPIINVKSQASQKIEASQKVAFLPGIAAAGTLMRAALSPRNLLAMKGVKSLVSDDEQQPQQQPPMDYTNQVAPNPAYQTGTYSSIKTAIPLKEPAEEPIYIPEEEPNFVPLPDPDEEERRRREREREKEKPKKEPVPASVKKAETFGEEEVGRGTKNRGEDSDPEHDGSGANFEEKGDSPELLKDIDGEGNAKNDPDQAGPKSEQSGSSKEDQDQALLLFNANLPLIIEYATSDKDGSTHPILMALDEILEAAFPGYKDAVEEAVESIEEATGEDIDDDNEEDESAEHIEDVRDKKAASHLATIWDEPNNDEQFRLDPDLEELAPEDYIIDSVEEAIYALQHVNDLKSQTEQYDQEGNTLKGIRIPPPKVWVEWENLFMDIIDTYKPNFNIRTDLKALYDISYKEDNISFQDVVQIGLEMVENKINRSIEQEWDWIESSLYDYWEQSGQSESWEEWKKSEEGLELLAKLEKEVLEDTNLNSLKEDLQFVASGGLPPTSVEAKNLTVWHYGFDTAPRPTPAPTMPVPGQSGTCPQCGYTHMPGTPCPTTNSIAPVMQPGATGVVSPLGTQPGTQPKVVTHIVEADASHLVHQHKEKWPELKKHEEDENDEVDDDEDDVVEDQDENTWVDEDGDPLVEGADYELHSTEYAIPDRITVEAIDGDTLVFTIHSGDVDYRDEITKEDVETFGYYFTPADTEGIDSVSDFALEDEEHPIRPGHDALPQEDDLTEPPTRVSREFTGAFKGDKPNSRQWLLSDEGSVAVDPVLMSKFAGKNFTPREQREFIEEEGSARNLDKLDLSGTHYVLDDDLGIENSLW